MKKIIRNFLVAIAVFFSLTSKAQTIDTTTIEGLYQYVFNVLDKTQIPTHYLEEYGAPVLSQCWCSFLPDCRLTLDAAIWSPDQWH